MFCACKIYIAIYYFRLAANNMLSPLHVPHFVVVGVRVFLTYSISNRLYGMYE